MNEIELWEQEILKREIEDQRIKEEAIYNFYGIEKLEEINYITSFDIDEALSESFNIKEFIKNIWDKFINILKKIATYVKFILRKIKEGIRKFASNAIKESEEVKSIPDSVFTVLIPQKKQDDFEKLMKISEAKYTDNSDKVLKEYIDLLDSPFYSFEPMVANKATSSSRDNFKDQHKNEKFKDDIITIIDQLEDTINAVETSDELKALKENNYEDTNKNKIKFTVLVKELEDLDRNIDIFESGLEDIKKKYSEFDEEDLSDSHTKLQSLMVKMCKSHISYYKTKIMVINTFFASINIDAKEASKYNTDTKKNFNIKNITKDLHYKKETSYDTITISGTAKVAQIKELTDELTELNDQENWSKYRETFKELTRLVYKESHDINVSISIKSHDQDFIVLSLLKQNYHKIPVGNKTLYHQSSESDLTELTPKAIINKRPRFCPEPLIYVHMSSILNRYHKILGTAPQDKIEEIREKLEKSNIYRIVDKIDYVYQDTEMTMGAACIIRQDTPVRIEKVDINKWLKERGR